MDRGESDEQVMGRLALGDDSALGELMARWGGGVWCFIDRMCGPAGCSEDVYQDVWMRVYRYRSKYDGRRPFRPYLFTIATNRCRTAISRGVYRPVGQRSLDGESADAPLSAAPQPIQTLISQEECQQLHLAVSRLPNSQRTVLLLYLLFSTEYGEIASVLGKRVGTVRVHMHEALKRLRGVLGGIALSAESQESQVDHERHG